jgi:uncharacterized protein (DUF427 family)
MSEIIYPKSARIEDIAQEWKTHGQKPSIIEKTAESEESVWGYPRPPSIQIKDSHIIIKLNNETLLDTTRSIRVCETASAPTYYFWKEDFKAQFIRTDHTTFCEWKGHGTYWSIKTQDQLIRDAAWSYERPYDEYQIIESLVGFYAGWVTDKIKGPIKGEVGSSNW